MSDTDATQARQNVVAEVDEIIEHVINANVLSMPYHVYSELFDAVDGLGVKIEKLQEDNAKLRELCADLVRQIKLAEYFDCFGCKCEKWGECDGECVFERRARELGVTDD